MAERRSGRTSRILDLAERARPAVMDIDQDFWLIDDEIVVLMHYDQDGRFVSAEAPPRSPATGPPAMPP